MAANIMLVVATILAIANTLLLSRQISTTQRQIDVFTRTMAASSNPTAFAVAEELAQQESDKPKEPEPLEDRVID